MIPKRKPTRNKDYLHWVKEQPCVVCGHPVSDAHHLIGHGMGKMGGKGSDLTAIPLCRVHHDDLHNGGYKTWERLHGSQWGCVQVTLMRALMDGVL
jgi:hypothetical protein